MDERLKQRLTGAVVLVALGVVLIPMLLRGSEPKRAPAPAPFSSGGTESGGGFVSRIVPLRVTEGKAGRGRPTESAPGARPHLSGRARSRVAAGWAVQLGVFANPRNALALRDRLKAKGYSAFVESSVPGPRAVTRVFVGPNARRKVAKTILEDLRRDTGLAGMLVEYPRGSARTR